MMPAEEHEFPAGLLIMIDDDMIACSYASCTVFGMEWVLRMSGGAGRGQRSAMTNFFSLRLCSTWRVWRRRRTDEESTRIFQALAQKQISGS